MSRALDISWQMTGNAKMLRAQLQASYNEQEILVQHQNDLLAERDHLYFALLESVMNFTGNESLQRQNDEA